MRLRRNSVGSMDARACPDSCERCAGTTRLNRRRMSARKQGMAMLRWLSVLASAASLVGVIVVNVRAGRVGDATVLRRSARRLGWGLAGVLVFTIIVYSIATVAN